MSLTFDEIDALPVGSVIKEELSGPGRLTSWCTYQKQEDDRWLCIDGDENLKEELAQVRSENPELLFISVDEMRLQDLMKQVQFTPDHRVVTLVSQPDQEVAA